MLRLWAGHKAFGDTWEPPYGENMTNCVDSEAPDHRPLSAPPRPSDDLRAALVGRTTLYRDGWPEDGRGGGSAAPRLRRCAPFPRGAFLHVVAYTRQMLALPRHRTADTLLDA